MKTSSVDQIILKLLSKEHAHLNSQQIFQELKTILPAVNQSTIYRSLNRLVNNGQVSVSDMGTGSAVYELVSDHVHHHLVCQQCNRVITITSDEVQKFFDQIEDQYKFKIITNHLVLFGVCNECESK
jgi:Fur family ferric uptake transcriptional regulator